ncbi:MAG: pseudouridine synthase [Desulfurococcales archaeon]|nr:pseudouridine synthase [Desulfurococcales archaeon]
MPAQLRNRHSLSKKEKRKLQRILSEKLLAMLDYSDCSLLEIGEYNSGIVYLCDSQCFLLVLQYQGENLYVPCLKRLLHLFRKGIWRGDIEVDRGAVQALMRGADLMVPGIRNVTGYFNNGDIVVILDEDSKAPVSVGKALVSSEDLKAMVSSKSHGKVVLNLHYVGDQVWKDL